MADGRATADTPTCGTTCSLGSGLCRVRPRPDTAREAHPGRASKRQVHHEPSRTASYGTLRAANPTTNRYTQISRAHQPPGTLGASLQGALIAAVSKRSQIIVVSRAAGLVEAIGRAAARLRQDVGMVGLCKADGQTVLPGQGLLDGLLWFRSKR